MMCNSFFDRACDYTIMNVIDEFKTFALRGNMIDMAVGIVIGGAFGKIIDSLVKDIIMPPLGFLLGRTDFSNLYITLKQGLLIKAPYPSLEAAKNAGAVTVNMGVFLNTVISFIIVAFSIFLVIKAINRLKAKQDAEELTKTCPYCFTVIDKRAVKCPDCTADFR